MRKGRLSLRGFFSDVNEFKWRMAVKSLFGGTLAGLLAVIYRLAVEKGTDFAVSAYTYMKLHPLFLFGWFAAAVGAGLLIAWLIKMEPMASGGGVPQVEGVVLYGMKMRWHIVIAVRYVAGILGSVFGLSFGPEGPSIQIGAAANQGLAKKACKTNIEKSYLVTAGAAAGLSAAFSAPLTGVIFALEEIHRSFSPGILLSAIAASLAADFISKHFFGLRPVLYFQNVPRLPLQMYGWLLLLGIFAGLFGVLTNRGLLAFQTAYEKIPSRFRPIIALFLAVPCGIFLPQILGSGQDLITIIERPGCTISMVAILLLAKILFSCTSFGSGSPGGIFMPIISIGALSGSLFSMLTAYIGVPSQYLPVFVICAMAGGLAACVKAPITSIVLTAELTGSFTYILPVSICSLIALFISDFLHTAPIYEALLDRFIAKKGYTISTNKRGELMEFPVEYGSEISGKMLKDVGWPKGSLVVGLRRGTEELIPEGATRIMPGDYLLILVPQNQKPVTSEKITGLCHRD